MRPTPAAAHQTARTVALALLAILLGLLRPGAAWAQTAPAGNAHPETQIVNDGGAGTPSRNPFDFTAEEALRPPPTPAQKHAFAQAVDLEPLRDLAVFHNGRVKILDTLARETVRAITGRKDYFEVIRPEEAGAEPEGKAKGIKLTYDPLFTLLDLSIDPLYYVDKPLIHVNYLPLREALIERGVLEFPPALTASLPPQQAARLVELNARFATAEQREWWKRIGRLPPLVIDTHIDSLEQRHGFEDSFRRGFRDVREGMSLLVHGWRNLAMVAPESADQPWRHLATLPPDSPAGAALADLAAAWRAADAARVNAAVRTLAAELPKINAERYPPGGAMGRRGLELAYNTVKPFEWGYWLYCLSLVTLLLAFGTGRRWLRATGTALLIGAVLMHAGGFAARCVLAERFAIQNQFESMTGLSLFATLVGLGIMLARRQYLFGAAAAGVGFMILITATQAGIPGVSIEREAAILNTSVLLKYHVTTVLVSYGLIALGFIISLFYLGTYYGARLRGAGAAPAGAGEAESGMLDVSATALGLDENAPKGVQRVLADLDSATMIVLQLAFWTLGVGILLGAWWADHSWGRWWAFDPKETWALITWIVYLIVMHVRFATDRNRALITAWLSIVGFGVMLFTYFGVNLLLPGLHAYA